MTEPPKGRAASTTFIFVTLLLDTLGIGLVVPVMPRLVGSFLGGDVSVRSTMGEGSVFTVDLPLQAPDPA